MTQQVEGRERPIPGPANPTTNLRRLGPPYVSKEQHLEVSRRAALAGMSVSKYLIALIERDEVDEDGCPTWAANRVQIDQMKLIA